MRFRFAATAVVSLMMAAALTNAGEVAGQVGPPIRGDTARAPADTVVPPPQAADTVQVPDSLRYFELPALHAGVPEGFGAGVWSWDRAALMATPAHTLLELLEQIPGAVPLRGGDYGTPEAFSAFGLGGGRVRIYWDGFEMLPLDGAVLDLSRVGLEGIESVRVERGMGEVRVELSSLRAFDPRPMSLVEAGTGDLDTNYFRGTFLHPRALGGSLGLALERMDTRGTQGEEEGARFGGWLRYTYHFGDRGGIRAEYRKATVQTALDTFPSEVGRTDWVVRGRYELAEGLMAEAFTGASAVDGPDDDLTPLDGDRSQHGVRASFERGPLWARSAFRLMTGPDLPSTSLELEAGGALAEVGGAAARWSRDSWDGEGASLMGVRAWTRPYLGLSGFASWESGRRGARIFQPRVPIPDEQDGEDGETEEPDEPQDANGTYRITDRTGLRLGGSFAWGPLHLSGAWLRLETDSLAPLGLHTDREGIVVPGGEHTGFEVSGRVALPLDGLFLYGSMQQWDEETRYLPGRTYRAGLDYHDVFLESRNFELWWGVGVQGRDPMLVPLPETDPPPDGPPALQRVPFYQTWDAFIEARILTLHLLIRWDNFSIRRRNQDFPGRVQPFTRATYGIRWTLWN